MSVKQIIEAIKAYEIIIIHRHVRPDPDALGSQAGLKEIIQASYPQKQVYIVGEEDPDLTFLVRMEQIDDAQYKDALVIVCDTANQPRIDDQRYDCGDKLIKIDHHLIVDEYGDIQWVDTEASSVSEMIYELYTYGRAEGWKMNAAAARLLYAGIVGDTGRFMFSSTTNKTFQYAADLVTYSFDRSELYADLYRERDTISRLKGYILQQFELSRSGVSSVKLTKDILKKYDVTPSETSTLVNVLSSVDGIKAWVFFIEEEDTIRVRFRSKGPAINQIAEKYDGGGHPMAAGATITTWEEAENIIQDMENLCQSV